MEKIKNNLKNALLSICFLFRPIIPIAVSFVFLLLTCALLVFIIINLDDSSKTYEILLAILTGVTASLLVSIMLELHNNYRFNAKRQRELREYFRCVAGYGINQNSIMESNTECESDPVLGSGRVYAVFYQLKKIIPSLREALNNRDYLYKMEIDVIDDILYDYDYLLIKIISIDLFGVFLDLIVDESENSDGLKEEQKDLIKSHEVVKESEVIDEVGLINESPYNYPALIKYLKKEAMRYDKREKDSSFYDEAPALLGLIIEKAIFTDRYIFNGFFEVTDRRYDLSKKMDENSIDNYLNDKNGKFEFRSNMISEACGNIDKAMIKLQKRAAKEPYIWVMASYCETNLF